MSKSHSELMPLVRSFFGIRSMEKLPCIGDVVRADGGREIIKTYAQPVEGSRRRHTFDELPQLAPGESVMFFEADADFNSNESARCLGTIYG